MSVTTRTRVPRRGESCVEKTNVIAVPVAQIAHEVHQGLGVLAVEVRRWVVGEYQSRA